MVCKRVVLYNTKLSYRNTKKNFLHTNLFITQNYLNFCKKAKKTIITQN